MMASKADIIARLQKDILSLQGYKPAMRHPGLDAALGGICKAFPQMSFPLGAVHEFYCNSKEEVAASGGFIAGILSSLMQADGALLWISSIRNIFPPALVSFGIAPDRIIFIDVKTEKEVLWVMEEALTCNGLAAVVGELKDISFTASRRFQLAVEKSGVTGFILRCQPRTVNVTACLTRWKVSSLPSILPGEMPGVGHPAWRIELLKVRNGKPGSWDIIWANGAFNPVYKESSDLEELQKKTG